MSTDTSTSISSQSSERTDSTVRRPTVREPETAHGLDLGADSPAEEVLETIRELLAIGRLKTARGLVERALRRFPDHPELGRLSGFLAVREAKSNPLVEPSTSDEIEWLSDPPENARGRWVALIGRQVVAMADSARELKKTLRSLDLARSPLVHRVAP